MDNKKEEDGEPDYNRVFCQRRTAEVGLYVDPFEAKAIDPQAHGTELCFLMELPDKLNVEFQKIPLDKIKGAFERHDLLQGVIVEKLHKCNVFSCSFETPEALEEMWKAYERQELGPVLSEVLVTEEIQRAVGTENLVLRTRIYKDEVDDCRKDIREGKRADYVFDNDRAMINKARTYQNQDLTAQLLLLRELFSEFEAQLGNFTLIIKQNLSGRQQINSFQEFEAVYTGIRKKNLNVKCFENMFRVREALAKLIVEVQAGIMHPLAQVHSLHETEHQKIIKLQMKTKLQTALDRLKPEFDHSKLKHIEWASKIVLKEHKLFLGLVSVLALGIETIINADQGLDEYISGFTDI